MFFLFFPYFPTSSIPGTGEKNIGPRRPPLQVQVFGGQALSSVEAQQLSTTARDVGKPQPGGRMGQLDQEKSWNMMEIIGNHEIWDFLFSCKKPRYPNVQSTTYINWVCIGPHGLVLVIFVICLPISAMRWMPMAWYIQNVQCRGAAFGVGTMDPGALRERRERRWGEGAEIDGHLWCCTQNFPILDDGKMDDGKIYNHRISPFNIQFNIQLVIVDTSWKRYHHQWLIFSFIFPFDISIFQYNP